MDGEKRKDHRQPLKYPAKIDLGDDTPPLRCELVDVSESGARLIVTEPDKVPDSFVLLLASDHGTSRRCKVVWREDNKIGVQFSRAAEPILKPQLRPRVVIR